MVFILMRLNLTTTIRAFDDGSDDWIWFLTRRGLSDQDFAALDHIIPLGFGLHSPIPFKAPKGETRKGGNQEQNTFSPT